MLRVPFGPHGQTVSRLAPLGDPRAYKTYGAVSPLSTHWRPATCEEADCEAFLHGWVTTVDLSTPEGQQMAHFITHDKTRRWTVQKVSATLVKFIYGPGQRCFAEHRTRPGTLLVHQGGRVAREHVSLADLAEDYTEHMGGIADQQARG